MRERIRPAGDESIVEKSEILLNDINKEFIDSIMKQIDAWLQFSSTKKMALPPCNAFQRRLIYQEVGKRYNAFLHLESISVKEGGHQKYMEIQRMTEEERKAYSLKKTQDLLDELDESVGFRKVLDMVASSKKLLVGHNLILDVCFLLAHFFGPLPESLVDFKSLLHTAFPKILDTKYLSVADSCLQNLIPSTILEDLVRFFSGAKFNEPTIQLAEGFHRYNAVMSTPAKLSTPSKSGQTNDDATVLINGEAACLSSVSPAKGNNAVAKALFHEAGFDAFQTGVAFLKMAHFLVREKEAANEFLDHVKEEGEVNCEQSLPFSVIQPYMNKLYLMRSDIPYLNLIGPEEQLIRPNVFVLHHFPREWRKNDIISHFEPFGTVYLRWIDDSTVMVTLQDISQFPNVLPHFQLHGDNSFQVSDYATFCNGQSHVTSPKRHESTTNDLSSKKARMEAI